MALAEDRKPRDHRAMRLLLLLCAFAGLAAAGDRYEKRWVYVSANLYVDANVPEVEALLRRAAAAGFNGVLFADYKMAFWWRLDDAERWHRNARRLREVASELGLELVAAVCPFGYSGSLLFHDPNLAAGMPVRDAPLVARGGLLVPEPTARIRNGSFEECDGDRAKGYAFQDPSSLDATVAHDGRVSLRFEDVGRADPHGHGRICQEVEARPWQQYLLRVWMKADRLNADELRVLVLAGDRTLQWQHLSANDRWIEQPRDLTTDWVEQRVTFNSLANERVRVYLGVWGGTTGRVWWDDLRIEPAPTLNLLRRESLPVTLRGEDGTVYREGKDYEPIADPALGSTPWKGSYETRHDPPQIRLLPGSRIADGATVLFSGYHATIVHAGQVCASLGEPKVFEICEEEVRQAKEALAPDAWFLSHDEIRCAGFEPGPLAGALLAENIRRCTRIAIEEGGGKPVHVWSDMFDPNHNARDGYYLVANSLEGSSEGLDKDVIVMKWGSGEIARKGLEFFAGRGHRQMIAAYYDGDVAKDHAAWTKAADGIPNVIGVMYTTWRNDYRRLEEFAKAWWGAK